jgi:two-component system, LytTR family, sensor histidine kinase AgrC
MNLILNENFQYLKKYIIQLCIAYIAAVLIVYLVCFNIIRYYSDMHMQADMKQTLSGIAVDINSELAKQIVSTRVLSNDNAIRRTVDFKLYYQLNEYCLKLTNAQNIKNLVITDIDEKVLFDSTNIFTNKVGNKSVTNYEIKGNEYNTLFQKGSLYFLLYFPLMNDGNNLCGSISSIYNMDDFKGLLNEKLIGTSYVIYPVFENKIVGCYTGLDAGGKYIGSEERKYTFYSGINVSGIEVMSSNITGSIKGSGIAIGIPISLYDKVQKENIIQSILWTIVALVIMSVLILLWVYSKSRIKLETEVQQLRMEKHDFIKHVNIVNSLAYNSNLTDLKEYIENLGNNISMDASLNTLENWAVSVLLNQKQIQALEKNIKFDLIVKTSLEKINVRTADLCIIIGNLIDNALEASEKLPLDARYVEIEISKEQENYVIRVMNKGEIGERDINKIFESGYSTKCATGHGVGLYIVSKIVNKYGGRISVDCEGGEVGFTVCF